MKELKDSIKELKGFIEQKGISQASIARSIGLSAGVISQYLKGKYNGDNADVMARVTAYIGNYQTKATKNNIIIKTRDFTSIHWTIDEVIISEQMGVIYGKAGTGKTVAVLEYVYKHPEAILIQTTPMITAKSLLQQILAQQGNKNAVGSAEALFHECVANFKRSERVLIVDEAENLTTKNLELIRRIFDFASVPVVLVGTYALLQNLKGRSGELLQLYSRISNKWAMLGLDKGDREALFGEFADAISKHTKDIRRGSAIFAKAKRLCALKSDKLNDGYIKLATQSVILD